MIKPEISDPKIGLCKQCLHSTVIHNARSSKFYLCELSKTDSRFVKYPRLPVLTCPGFKERVEPTQSGDLPSSD